MTKPKLKLVQAKRKRAPLIFKALIVRRKDNITAKSQRAYSTIERAVLGATAWIMRDGQAGSRVVVYRQNTPNEGQEIAVVNMSSLGNIWTTYPWGDAKD